MLIKFGKKAPTEQEIFQAKVDHVMKELKNVDATEEERMNTAALLAQRYRGKRQKNALTNNMRHVAEVPADDWFRLTSKYGIDEVHSKPFLKYLQKHYSQLATSKI